MSNKETPHIESDEVALMSNQERIKLFGPEVLFTYKAQGRRRTQTQFAPAFSSEGAAWLQQKEKMEKEMGITIDEKMPAEYILPTQPFRRSKQKDEESV